ncbi:MAG: DHHA1 domain-containing protein [Liquorilactobacillus hordei]|uniref:DHHA1 domain-containing protein n=1 Tax=Liquorilactobacillus hordei TaxID=468911 RepID=UPI0039E72C9E
MTKEGTYIKMFSHNDLDGVASPVILRQLLTMQRYDLTFYPPTFSSTGREGTIDDDIVDFLNSNKAKLTDEVYIMDLTPSEEVLKLLDQKSDEYGFKWQIFDHHVTAVWSMKKYPSNVHNYQHMGSHDHSATSITTIFVEYAIPTELMKIEKFRKIGQLAEVVRLYDTWEWFNNASELAIQAKKLNDLFYLYPPSQRFNLLSIVASAGVDEILNKNRNFIYAAEEREAEYIEGKIKNSNIIRFTKYNIAVVYAEQYISNLGNAMCRELDVDFSIVLHGSDGRQLSLRSVLNIDVSKVAKEYFNGGGHEHAAGGTATDDFIKAVYSL